MYLIHCISRVLRDKFPAGDSGRVSEVVKEELLAIPEKKKKKKKVKAQVVKEEPLAIPDHLVQGLLDG